jgi:hypothetical protein
MALCTVVRVPYHFPHLQERATPKSHVQLLVRRCRRR